MKISARLNWHLILAIVVLACLLGLYFYLPQRSPISSKQYVKSKLALATSYFQQGLINPQEPKFFDYAVEQYEEILKFDPKQKEAMLGLANVYTKKEIYDKAEKLFKGLIASDPKNASYQERYGFHYLARGMKVEALERANLATSYDAKNIEAYILRAVIYEEEQNLSGAIIEYKKALIAARAAKRAAQEANLYFGLGGLFYNTGLVYEAAGQFEKVVKLWPKYTAGYLKLANFYLRCGLTDKSISTLNSLLAFDKKSPQAYTLFGLAYLKKRDYQASFAHFKKAKSLGADIKESFLENLDKVIQNGKKAQQEKNN